MSLQALFLNLVTLFHVDAPDAVMEQQCAVFASQVALRMHEMGSAELKLCLIPPEHAERLLGVHVLLKSYGFGLTRRLRAKQDALVIGVRRAAVPFTQEPVQIKCVYLNGLTEEVAA